MHFWHVQRKRSWIITGKGEHRAYTHGDYLFLCHPFKEEESQIIKYEKWSKRQLKDPTQELGTIVTCKNLTCDSLWLLQKGKTKRISSDYRKKPQLPLPRQILGVADRVSWQGRRLCDLEEGVSELSTVFLSNLQLYFFQFVICILLTLTRVCIVCTTSWKVGRLLEKVDSSLNNVGTGSKWQPGPRII